MRDERRNKTPLKYTSARGRAEKQAAGSTANYLRIPDGVKMFKPKAGLIVLDILPFVAGKGNPWAEEGCIHWERTYFAHRGIGANQETYLCPRATAKKPCPVCEYRAKLRSEGNDDDEQTIKDLAEKQRQLFNIIDLKNPGEGIQLWDMSYHCFGRALDARLRNSEEQDGWDQFFFLEGGFSLRIGLVEKSFGGYTFLEAESIDFKPRKDYPESILDETYCLDDLLILKPYDELKSAFLQVGGKDKQEDPQEDPQEEERPRRKPAQREQEEEHPRRKPASREQEPDWDQFDDQEKPKKSGRREDPEPEEGQEPEEERPRRKPAAQEETRPTRKPAREPEEEPQEEQRPRRRVADQEPEEQEERPRRKPAAREEEPEEQEEDRPHVRSYSTPKPDPEEQEERPRRKPAAREEEPEEAPAPKSKKSKTEDWD